MLSCLVILKEAQRLPRLFLVFAIQQPPHTCPSLHPFLSCVSIIGPAHSRACEQAWLLLSLRGILLQPYSIHVSVKHNVPMWTIPTETEHKTPMID